MFAIDYSVLKC